MTEFRETPFVSIIVITFNMKNHISRCLESLESIDYPREKYEIIVVDNGSTDGTQEVCDGFNVKYVFQKRKKRGHARNVGIKHAKGEIIAFVDADCEVKKDWLKSHVRDHADTFIGSVCGSVINPYMKFSNKFAIAAHIEEFAEFDETSPRRLIYHVPCCNASFKKHVLLRAGVFDKNLHVGEDFLLSQRIVDLGFELLFDPSAKVLHYGTEPDMLSRSYFEKEIQFGRAYFHVQIRKKNIFRRLPVHRVFVLLFAPSIIIARIFREVYKLKYVRASTNPFLLPIMVMGGLTWGCTYVKEALSYTHARAPHVIHIEGRIGK